MVAVHGVGAAFFDPASTGLVPQTVSAPELQRANALLGIAHSSGGVLGPAAGGAVIALAGPGAALATDAGTFVVSAFALLAMHPPEHDRGAERAGFVAELGRGLVGVPGADVGVGRSCSSTRSGTCSCSGRSWCSAR